MSLLLPGTVVAALLAIVTASCAGGGSDNVQVWDSQSSDMPTPRASTEGGEYSDLKMFELSGPVKECSKETFYSVTLSDDGKSAAVDSTPELRHTTNLYFDRLGNYVVSAHEKIERDAQGRIVYWRDRRPNAKGVDPGMLRDTIRYIHVNDNVLKSSGMGEFAITVFDNDNRIVGQYSEPQNTNAQTAAYNVPRCYDEYGNWTERLTVWVSRNENGKPHISYTLDTRKITYY